MLAFSPALTIGFIAGICSQSTLASPLDSDTTPTSHSISANESGNYVCERPKVTNQTGNVISNIESLGRGSTPVEHEFFQSVRSMLWNTEWAHFWWYQSLPDLWDLRTNIRVHKNRREILSFSEPHGITGTRIRGSYIYYDITPQDFDPIPDPHLARMVHNDLTAFDCDPSHLHPLTPTEAIEKLAVERRAGWKVIQFSELRWTRINPAQSEHDCWYIIKANNVPGVKEYWISIYDRSAPVKSILSSS